MLNRKLEAKNDKPSGFEVHIAVYELDAIARAMSLIVASSCSSNNSTHLSNSFIKLESLLSVGVSGLTTRSIAFAAGAFTCGEAGRVYFTMPWHLAFANQFNVYVLFNVLCAISMKTSSSVGQGFCLWIASNTSNETLVASHRLRHCCRSNHLISPYPVCQQQLNMKLLARGMIFGTKKSRGSLPVRESYQHEAANINIVKNSVIRSEAVNTHVDVVWLVYVV